MASRGNFSYEDWLDFLGSPEHDRRRDQQRRAQALSNQSNAQVPSNQVVPVSANQAVLVPFNQAAQAGQGMVPHNPGDSDPMDHSESMTIGNSSLPFVDELQPGDHVRTAHHVRWVNQLGLPHEMLRVTEYARSGQNDAADRILQELAQQISEHHRAICDLVPAVTQIRQVGDQRGEILQDHDGKLRVLHDRTCIFARDLSAVQDSCVQHLGLITSQHDSLTNAWTLIEVLQASTNSLQETMVNKDDLSCLRDGFREQMHSRCVPLEERLEQVHQLATKAVHKESFDQHMSSLEASVQVAEEVLGQLVERVSRVEQGEFVTCNVPSSSHSSVPNIDSLSKLPLMFDDLRKNFREVQQQLDKKISEHAEQHRLGFVDATSHQRVVSSLEARLQALERDHGAEKKHPGLGFDLRRLVEDQVASLFKQHCDRQEQELRLLKAHINSPARSASCKCDSVKVLQLEGVVRDMQVAIDQVRLVSQQAHDGLVKLSKETEQLFRETRRILSNHREDPCERQQVPPLERRLFPSSSPHAASPSGTEPALQPASDSTSMPKNFVAVPRSPYFEVQQNGARFHAPGESQQGLGDSHHNATTRHVQHTLGQPNVVPMQTHIPTMPSRSYGHVHPHTHAQRSTHVHGPPPPPYVDGMVHGQGLDRHFDTPAFPKVLMAVDDRDYVNHALSNVSEHFLVSGKYFDPYALLEKRLKELHGISLRVYPSGIPNQMAFLEVAPVSANAFVALGPSTGRLLPPYGLATGPGVYGLNATPYVDPDSLSKVQMLNLMPLWDGEGRTWDRFKIRHMWWDGGQQQVLSGDLRMKLLLSAIPYNVANKYWDRIIRHGWGYDRVWQLVQSYGDRKADPNLYHDWWVEFLPPTDLNPDAMADWFSEWSLLGSKIPGGVTHANARRQFLVSIVQTKQCNGDLKAVYADEVKYGQKFNYIELYIFLQSRLLSREEANLELGKLKDTTGTKDTVGLHWTQAYSMPKFDTPRRYSSPFRSRSLSPGSNRRGSGTGDGKDMHAGKGGRGRRDRRDRNGRSTTPDRSRSHSPGVAKGKCHRCGKPGHYRQDCKEELPSRGREQGAAQQKNDRK